MICCVMGKSYPSLKFFTNFSDLHVIPLECFTKVATLHAWGLCWSFFTVFHSKDSNKCEIHQRKAPDYSKDHLRTIASTISKFFTDNKQESCIIFVCVCFVLCWCLCSKFLHVSLIIVIDIPTIIMSPAVMKLLLFLYHYFNTVALLKQVN